MPYKHGPNLRIRREFSWGEFVDTAEQHKDRYSGWYREDDFGHYTSGDAALEMARGEGFKDAIPQAKELLTHIETDLGMAEINSFETAFDVAGSEIDMGRFLTGVPECMRESQPIKVMRTGRVVKVLVPVCCGAFINSSTMIARGSAVMALVDAFAMMQHSIEVYAVIAIGAGTNAHLSYAVKVQESDQALNMGRIMYALAHPTMLRKLGFAAEHMESPEVQSRFSIGGSYGYPGYETGLDDVDINVENAIVLPALNSNSGWSKEESVRWINKQIQMIRDHAS